MSINDMATSQTSFVHNIYIGSPAYPPSAPRLAKSRHGSLSCFSLPSFNMAAETTFDGDLGIRLGLLRSRGN